MSIFTTCKKFSFFVSVLGISAVSISGCGDNPDPIEKTASSCFGEFATYDEASFPNAGYELTLNLEPLQVSSTDDDNLPTGNVARVVKTSNRYQIVTIVDSVEVFYKREILSNGTLGNPSIIFAGDPILSVSSTTAGYSQDVISNISRTSVLYPFTDGTDADTSFAFAQDTLQFAPNTRFPSIGIEGVETNPLRGVYEGFVSDGTTEASFGKFYSSRETPGTLIAPYDSLKKDETVSDIFFQAQVGSQDLWNFNEVAISIEPTSDYGKPDNEANSKTGSDFMVTSGTSYEISVQTDSTNARAFGEADETFMIDPNIHIPNYSFVATGTETLEDTVETSGTTWQISKVRGRRTVDEDFTDHFTRTKVFTLDTFNSGFVFTGDLNGTFDYDETKSAPEIKNSDLSFAITGLAPLNGFVYRPWLLNENNEYAKIDFTFDGSADVPLTTIADKANISIGELATWDRFLIVVEPETQASDVVIPWSLTAFSGKIDIATSNVVKFDFSSFDPNVTDRSFTPNDTDYVYQAWWYENRVDKGLKDLAFGGAPNAFQTEKFRYINGEFLALDGTPMVFDFKKIPQAGQSPEDVSIKKLDKMLIAVTPRNSTDSLNGIVLFSTPNDTNVTVYTEKQELVFPSKATFDSQIATNSEGDSTASASAVIENDTLKLCFGTLPFVQTILDGGAGSIRFLNYSYYFWLKGKDGTWTKVDNINGDFEIDEIRQFQSEIETIPNFDMESFGGAQNLRLNIRTTSSWSNYETLYLSLTPNGLIGGGDDEEEFFTVEDVDMPFIVTPFSFSIANAIAEGQAQ